MKAWRCHSYWAGKKCFTSVSIGIALSNSSYEQAEIFCEMPTLQCSGQSLAKHVTNF